jgi:hypothetical protein
MMKTEFGGRAEAQRPVSVGALRLVCSIRDVEMTRWMICNTVAEGFLQKTMVRGARFAPFYDWPFEPGILTFAHSKRLIKLWKEGSVYPQRDVLQQ